MLCRQQLVAQRLERRHRALVTAVADKWHQDLGGAAVAVDGRLDRRLDLPAGQGQPVEARDRGPAPDSTSTSPPADDHDGRGLRARERLLDLLVVADDRDAVRKVARAQQRRVQTEGRQRQRDQQSGCAERGRQRMTHHRAQHRVPRARLCAHASHAAAVDLVAQAAEQRRQHRQRADHRCEHDQHRADADRVEDAAAGQQHPGHRDQHGDP